MSQLFDRPESLLRLVVDIHQNGGDRFVIEPLGQFGQIAANITGLKSSIRFQRRTALVDVLNQSAAEVFSRRLCGQIRCGGTCVDTVSDPSNCGQCGLTCQPGQVCSSAPLTGLPVKMVLPFPSLMYARVELFCSRRRRRSALSRLPFHREKGR